MTDEDLERSQRLFQWLAENEPPQHFDPTQAGKTARQSLRMPSVPLPIYQRKRFYQRHGVRQVSKWLGVCAFGVFWFALLSWFVFRLVGLAPRVVNRSPEATPQILPAPPIFVPQDTVQRWLEQPLKTPAVLAPAIPQQDSPLTVGEIFSRLESIWVTPQALSLEDLAAQYGLLPCTLITANDPSAILTREGEWRILPADGIELELNTPLTLGELAAKTGVDADAIRLHDANPRLWGASSETILEGRVFVPTQDFTNCLPWTRPPWLVNDAAAWQALLGCAFENPYRGYPTNAPMQNFKLVKNFDPVGHYGVDLIAPENSPVYAAGVGVVRWAGWHADGYGYTVVIDHGGSHTLYAHLKTFIVQCGQPVAAQQLIASVGSSGNADGNHLHFELRNGGFMPVDPNYVVSLGFPHDP